MTYNYPLARILHIKPKHESQNFPFISIVVKNPFIKIKIFYILWKDNTQSRNGINICKRYYWTVIILPQKNKVYIQMGVLHFLLPWKIMVCK